jgi:hypothetical protein
MGWSVTQIVQEVSRRTEHRADKKIDLRMEFFLGLDEFLLENHFWWAKKRFMFQTVVGSAVYDLALSAAGGTDNNGNPIQPGGNITDFGELDEIVTPSNSIQSPLTPPNQQLPCELVALFDPAAQLQAVYNTQQDQPSAYFIDTSTSPTALRFQAPCNMVATFLGTYWAVSQVTDPTIDKIPLVLPKLHWGLIYVLERRVYEFLYGEDDPRYTMATNRYNEFCIKATRQAEFSGKKVREMSVGRQSMRIVRAHS